MSSTRQPVRFKHFEVSYPGEHILQVTINRPDKLNCIDKATSREIAQIWEQLDQDETLWVGIITGVGRAFCTGADLHGMCIHPRGGAVVLEVESPLSNMTRATRQSGTR